ncbi:MAG: NAD(P)/FAD-dependent oxidoreductase [Bacteroidetes bacterium]|nr:NAD(P)/FAD-dependent oxidoreductase [Bacteroidota bacterium]MCH8524606.1 NAD(P)/FAD-dependent oxidoreductase [Balneolales bacterium]
MEDHNLKTESGSGGISRRDALKYIGLGGGGLLLAGTGGFYGYRKSLQLSRTDAAKVRNAKIVVAGGSIGGLTVAARLMRAVPDANITIIEPKDEHHYQPGYTLVAAGVYKPEEVIFDQKSLFMPGMKWVKDYVEAFEPDQNRVITRKGDIIDYDYLVVGLGVETNMNSVENLAEALETPYVANVYKLESGIKFKNLAQNFGGGKAVFTYPTGYVKCGGAPQKITWLTEDLWRGAGMRDQVEVHFHTPQNSLFPIVPKVDNAVRPLIEARGIQNHYHQVLKAIDISTRTAIFEERMPDESVREIRQHYDLLHPMPTFRTPKPLREGPLTREGIGGQLDVDRITLQHNVYPNVFGVGDNAATGAPKTAATIRKQAPVVAGNIVDAILGYEPSNAYDGVSGCPLLTRYGRCMMFEFGYNGELVNEWIFQPTKETRLWWDFKVHGLKRLYRHVMMNGYV